MVTVANLLTGVVIPLQLVPEGSRAVVFRRIYVVFLVLGTVVGVVVTAYMVWKAWKYRASADHGTDADRPQLGELPSGGGGGRKLFLSFSLSAIIVVSLISWTYFTLLYVENPGPTEADEEPMEVRVIGHQFYWEFVYPNGHSTNDELVVPEDRRVRLVVTSADVFHNFGIPELRAKSDAIPGQETSTWFLAEETGTYQASCYELCGSGHSHMTGTVKVVSQSEFETWYANTTNSSTDGNDNSSSDATGNSSSNASANGTENESASFAASTGVTTADWTIADATTADWTIADATTVDATTVRASALAEPARAVRALSRLAPPAREATIEPRARAEVA